MRTLTQTELNTVAGGHKMMCMSPEKLAAIKAAIMAKLAAIHAHKSHGCMSHCMPTPPKDCGTTPPVDTPVEEPAVG